MKKKILNGLMLACLFMASATLISCLNSDDETIVLENEPTNGKSLRDDYFTIEDGEFHNGNVPSSTDNSDIGTVTFNNQALSGGMNFITIRTTRIYKVFYISVEGVNGYYTYTPSSPTRDGNYYIYTIFVYYSTKFSEDITMYISGETSDGTVSKPYPGHVTYIESKSGDLNINLTFTTAKDVDLHLVLPNGTEIFYGNRGGIKDGVAYGLDHDSNAGCEIDNLNNENIFIPASLVTEGTYKVYVNMYANCNTSVGPTTWSVAARYKGTYVTNQLNNGRNPMNGSYAAAARNGDMTEVIRFTLTSSQVSRGLVPFADFDAWKPIPLNEMDQMKLEEAGWKN